MKNLNFIFLLLACFSLTVSAQLTLNDDKSTMTIDGTSNIHDWTENVGTMSGKLDAEMNGEKLKSIKAITVTIPVKSIQSGKSAMDKNTYEALKADKHPNIQFTLKSASVSGDKIKLTGDLQIAGTTKSVSFTTTYSGGSKSIVISGSYTLNMKDFNIEPPTALMGSVSTGEKVTMKFKLYFTN